MTRAKANANEGPVLGDVAPTKRVGASVVREGRRWVVTAVVERTELIKSNDPYGRRTVRSLQLWTDESGEVELLEIDEKEGKQLPLLGLHTIHRPRVKQCVRTDHREAPAEATCCPFCAVPIEALA